jgi:hypothetical protein
MKKTVMIFLVLFALGLFGGLYNTLAQLDKLETAQVALTDTNSFPYEMPNVIMQPISVVLLY